MSDQSLAAEIFETDGLPTLERYTEIACLSPSFDSDWVANGAIDEAVELLRSWCSGRGLPNTTVEIVRVEGRTPVLLVDVAASEGATLRGTTLLYGHFDKQPPLGTWRAGLDAFRPVRQGDRLYGRGTADDGYATFAGMAAIESLVRREIAHGRIVMLIEGCEESGSPDLEDYLDHLADRLGEVSLVICLDSGCISYDRLWITTSLRGVIVGVLTVQVMEEGVHSGHAGGIVPSSFRIARQLISRIEDEATGEILLEELKSVVPAHRLAEIESVATTFGPDAAGVFPVTDGLELQGKTVAERIVNGTWRACLALTGEAGIPELAAGGNVLRPMTALKLSIRLPPNVDAMAAASALERALTSDPPARASVQFEVEHPAQGWDAPPAAEWLADAATRASMAHFGNPPNALGLGGSIPFMAALGLRYPGAQFLATGVLGPESNAHGPNEFLHVPTARAVAASVADILAEVP